MFFDAGWVDFSEYKIVHKSLFVWRISLENVNVFVIDSAVPLMDLAYRRVPRPLVISDHGFQRQPQCSA